MNVQTYNVPKPPTTQPLQLAQPRENYLSWKLIENYKYSEYNIQEVKKSIDDKCIISIRTQKKYFAKLKKKLLPLLLPVKTSEIKELPFNLSLPSPLNFFLPLNVFDSEKIIIAMKIN